MALITPTPRAGTWLKITGTVDGIHIQDAPGNDLLQNQIGVNGGDADGHDHGRW